MIPASLVKIILPHILAVCCFLGGFFEDNCNQNAEKLSHHMGKN